MKHYYIVLYNLNMENIKDKNIILFDLDGTITDSYPAITTSFLYAIKDYDVTLTDDELSSVIGPPLKESFMRLVGADPFEAWDLTLKYREFYNTSGMYNCKVYEGIEDCLKALKGAGKRLAIATSKPEPQSVEILKHFDLLKYFEFVAADDNNYSRPTKEEVIEYALELLNHPNVKDIAMVGDRKYDIVGAKSLGISGIGVTFGFGSTKELKDAGADYIVNSAKELKELLI